MAGAGFRTFVAGETLTAAQANTYLMQQAVMYFSTTSARSSAISSPSDGMVTYIAATDTIEIYDGSNWQVLGSTTAWTAYTPTLTNLTLGNGTLTAVYQTQGKTVNVRGRFTLGSTSAVSGSATFSTPTTPLSGSFAYGAGHIVAGGTTYMADCRISGSTILVAAVNAAGTYATKVATSATIPGTFTTGDSITFQLSYETT